MCGKVMTQCVCLSTSGAGVGGRGGRALGPLLRLAGAWRALRSGASRMRRRHRRVPAACAARCRSYHEEHSTHCTAR